MKTNYAAAESAAAWASPDSCPLNQALVLPTREAAEAVLDQRRSGRVKKAYTYIYTNATVEETTLPVSTFAQIGIAAQKYELPNLLELCNLTSELPKKENYVMNLYAYAVVEIFPGQTENGLAKAPVILQDFKTTVAANADALKQRVMVSEVAGLKPANPENVRVAIQAIGY